MAASIADRLQELGLVLPPVMPPAGTYVGCVQTGQLVHVGGHGPVDGSRVIRGKVGSTVTLEQGREAARMTALSILATLDAALGGLDSIVRIVKVFGMVNAAPGFDQMPAVIDGCSDLLVDVFASAAGTPDRRSAWPSCRSTSPSRSSSSRRWREATSSCRDRRGGAHAVTVTGDYGHRS